MGNKQRTYDGCDKSAGSSPEVTTNGLILTAAFDAHEERDVATVDIETAFLHAVNDEEILMKLRGKIVELVVQLEPTMYRKYVTTGPNGEPILYVKLLRKCAMGNKQRTYDGCDKSAGSSPEVTTNGLILTAALTRMKNEMWPLVPRS